MALPRDQPLAGAGLGQSHEMLDLHVLIQFAQLRIGQCGRLLTLNQIHDAGLGRIRWAKVDDALWSAAAGKKIDELIVCEDHVGILSWSRY